MQDSVPVGCAPGTETTVRDLFYNIPARKKFLKSNSTEERHITEVVSLISLAHPDVAFELGFNGEKYDLILSPEGKRTQLFPLVYFQEHIPASVQKNWNVLVGRQPSPDSVFHVGDYEISAEDVSVWVDMPNDKRVSLTLYCEKLLSLLAENGDIYAAGEAEGRTFHHACRASPDSARHRPESQ